MDAGRSDKLEMYRKLDIREVWYWRKGRILPYALRGERYEPIERSELLPDLDLDLVTTFLDRPTAYEAIRDFRAAIAK